jgi:flagellar hook-basal body complex protein FliE
VERSQRFERYANSNEAAHTVTSWNEDLKVAERIDIQSVLNQMRQMQSLAQGHQRLPGNQMIEADRAGPARAGLNDQRNPVGSVENPSFGQLLEQAVNRVNDLQMESGRLSTALERGESEVTLTQAMIASQKASVAFQAMTQVRNKLVNAYETVMNMPI